MRQRSYEADAVVAELERQRIDGARHARDLEVALGHYEAGMRGDLDRFAAAVEKFGQETLKHMAPEESTVLPLAKEHLTAEDWSETGTAFSENGDPRFDAETDHDCRDLFTAG
ncbi:MAG: hypothetical protein OEL20_09180 [Sulfuritalea sp.]|nr:hypothetical protein [Sulfuritalea sp.]